MKIANKIVMKKLNEIKPYFRNPRKNEKTVEMLVKVIPQVGFNVPLVIDKNNVIVKGHARYKAAFKLGMEEVPCIITDASEEEINLDRITDNRISELSEWLNDGLEHEIDMLDLDFDDILKDLNLKQDVIENDVVDFDGAETFEITPDYEALKQIQQQKMEEAIKQAELKQAEITLPKTKKYVKCVCSKCGETFYIDVNKLVIVDE